jgi:hypothetical protein
MNALGEKKIKKILEKKTIFVPESVNLNLGNRQ